MSSGQSDGKDSSLQGDIFPLRLIPDHWLLINSLYLSTPSTAEEVGPVHALRATLHMLKNFYYFDTSESWKKMRDVIFLGLIKDTKKYGNTSVSMGAAKRVLLEENNNNVNSSDNPKTAGFLNCGTGGIKYQLYDARGLLRAVAEYKPKDAASPNALKIGNFSPKKEISLEECKKLLERDLNSAELPWSISDKSVPVYAFVTGTIRQYWEEADEQEKLVLEMCMKSLFEPFQILPLYSSYFVTQDEEGNFELKGAQAMYANLVSAHVLEEGLEVVGSFGVGRGSCQWMIAGKDGAPELIGHKAGMGNLCELAKLNRMLSNTYSSQPEHFQNFLKNIQHVKKPVIALKSGAALLLDIKENSYLKVALKTEVAYRTRTVRIALLEDRTRLQSLTWTGSLDRLCAEGALKLQATTTEIETVYGERGGKLVILTNVDDIKEHELLLLGPIVLPSPPSAPATSTAAAATSGPTTTRMKQGSPTIAKNPSKLTVKPNVGNGGKSASSTSTTNKPRALRDEPARPLKSPSCASPRVSPKAAAAAGQKTEIATPRKSGSKSPSIVQPPWR